MPLFIDEGGAENSRSTFHYLSPRMECMLRIVVVTWMSLSRAMQELLPKNDFSASPGME